MLDKDYSYIKIAYFSAEIGIREDIKTYSGGLGILAGGVVKAMADLKAPFCAVTLLYKYGYFKQKIIDDKQVEVEDEWDYRNILEDTGKETKVNISGEDVYIKIWKYEYEGITGYRVPIFFLDTHLDKNPEWAKELTNRLYQGDRISQEIILGIGGVRALKELGLINIIKYHMNEGHSSFLTLELYKNFGYTKGWNDDYVKEVCVFTTHTPIPAGHDKFPYKLVEEKLKGEKDIIPLHIKKLAGENHLNMTKLGMSFSSFINAVSRKHQEVTKKMFPEFEINYITNGVHVSTWASDDIAKVYDNYMPGWRVKNRLLRDVFKIPNEVLYDAHVRTKKKLIKYVNEHNLLGTKFNENFLTISFARRFVEYKDAELIFKNINELKKLGKSVQFIFAGKAHKKDIMGKEIITRILKNAEELKDYVNIAFLENYDMNLAKLLVSGSDLWLNTPIPPNEASGTSGMKAAVNGVLHFSRLDGWAIESFEMNCGGFPLLDYEDFLITLKYKIIPMFYHPNKNSWIESMKLAIGNNASYFNTHRMAKEYLRKAYKFDGYDFL